MLFGTLAFLQTMADPAEGLASQPTLSLLDRTGKSLAGSTDFAALVSLPWAIKPVFGAICDLLPVFGSRRKAYLILAAAVALIGFAKVYQGLSGEGRAGPLLGWLVLATAGVAFSDVASDALMIEEGQPRGLTGRFQSIQWSCTYAATILTGTLGGWFSHHRDERAAMGCCVAIVALLLLVSLLGVREPRRDRVQARRPGQIRDELATAIREPGLWTAGVFLFLWNFNPFSSLVLRSYLIGPLRLGEPFYGKTQSLFAVACLVASLAYGSYCRRVPMRWLVHASIALGVAQTLAYGGVVGPTSAVVVTIFAGLTYMTATLIQLDMAARLCPPRVAATAFALLMAGENLATTGSLWVGGRLFVAMAERTNATTAYGGLVALGAATTAACWLLVPWLPDREGLSQSA